MAILLQSKFSKTLSAKKITQGLEIVLYSWEYDPLREN